MSVPPEVAEVLRRWVRKAEHDLEAATLILAGESHCPYDTAGFHCHQAADRYLKALLTLLGAPLVALTQNRVLKLTQELTEVMPLPRTLAINRPGPATRDVLV